MEKLKIILIILGSLTIQLVTNGQEEVFEKIVLKEGECEIEYLKNSSYLKSSLKSIPILNKNKTIKYIDETGTMHKYYSSVEKPTIWCQYEGICKSDTSLNETYYIARPIYLKKLISKTNNIKIKYNLSPVVNSNNPKTCSDIFYVSVKPYKEENMFSKTVVDQRTDSTSSNTKIKFHSQYEIDNTIYKDVYEDQVADYHIIYNFELGIIMWKNLTTNRSLRLKPNSK